MYYRFGVGVSRIRFLLSYNYVWFVSDGVVYIRFISLVWWKSLFSVFRIRGDCNEVWVI